MADHAFEERWNSSTHRSGQGRILGNNREKIMSNVGQIERLTQNRVVRLFAQVRR